MHEALVYTKHDCKWCVKVKELLTSKDWKITERNIDDDEEALMSSIELGHKTMPQVYIDGIQIGGFEATEAFISHII